MREGDAINALRNRLRAPLEERAAKALERTLVARPEQTDYINLADNDYLGLSREPEVIAAGKAALDKWGASSCASPLISGYTEEHAALERELADWCGLGHGLVWNTGFAANAAVLGSLPKPGDLVLADRLIHASMISGILASGARLIRYPHLDLKKLRELLEKHRDHDGVVWVVTESVFSMDGDYPDLKQLASLKDEYGFVLVVDEAHATGWFGPTGAGLVERQGVADSVDILVGTLGKGLGGMGAYTLFHEELFRRHLMNFAGEFVYSTYLAPACAASARAAIRRTKELHAGGLDTAGVSRRWREALRAVVPDTPEGDSPVIAVPLGDAARVMEVSQKLLADGWRIGAVRPPTVPDGGARLRISLRLGLDEKAPAEFAGALRKALG
jgi:8-amino-7-oxononanoate synthase